MALLALDAACLDPLGRRVQGLELRLRLRFLHEATTEGIKLVRVGDVTVEADAQELGQDIDAVEPAVDAVADRDINETILASHGHCWLAAQLGQWVQPAAPAAAEDQAQNALH